MKIAHVIEAKKEITVAVFEGRISKEQAVERLEGIKDVLAVTATESKSEKLKGEVSKALEGLNATITTLQA